MSSSGFIKGTFSDQLYTYKILRDGKFDRFSLVELTPHHNQRLYTKNTKRKVIFKDFLHTNEAYIYNVI